MQTIPYMEKADPWGKIVTLDIIPSENKALSDLQLSLAKGHELKLRPARLPPNITSEKSRGVLHFCILLIIFNLCPSSIKLLAPSLYLFWPIQPDQGVAACIIETRCQLAVIFATFQGQRRR